MNTSSLVKNLPKYLAVILCAFVLTSALVHFDAKASSDPSTQTHETDIAADDSTRPEDVTSEPDDLSGQTDDAPENVDTPQSETASLSPIPESNSSVAASNSQPDTAAQTQAIANDEPQLALADEAPVLESETVTAADNPGKDATADPVYNPHLDYILGGGKGGDGDGEGDHQPDKSLLDLVDYYHQD